ncbi:MAG: cation-translocating P-type ATPase C-terminal domain-containing protein, partial [Candidatus Bathyarchaeota archaeon]|nr:cation-translocating P-type ATPase C-terminal domain-containing protein [Candidatus Bathyarchaeota archaeon]
YLVASIEILFINFVMDGPPALALGFEKAAKGVMDQKPLRIKSILTLKTAKSIFLSAVVMMLVTVGVYFVFEAYMPALALTGAFSVFVIMQLFNAFNCRFSDGHFYASPKNNKYLLVSLFAMLTLVFVIVEVPVFQEPFSTVSLGIFGWSIVLPASALILLFEEIKKFVVRKRKRSTSDNVCQ